MVAMAAGSAKVGAAMPVKLAETKAAVDIDAELVAAAGIPVVEQPASNEFADNAPSGNIGAVAKNLSALRREVWREVRFKFRFVSAMLLISVVKSKSQICRCWH